MSRIAAALTGLVLIGAPAAAFAQHGASAPQPGATQSMQGDQASWIADPHMHAFYDLTVQAFAAGPAKVDQKAFQEKSFVIFRDFGVSRHVPPDAMVDHLKLIPGQVVQIAKEDPAVLKSYDNFVAAVFGPQ